MTLSWMPGWWTPGWWMPVVSAPFVGSLLGVLVRRLPAGRPVALARSSCESCERPLCPLELVPVVSYLVQRGRCRGCGARIAPMHLAIELAATGVALWAASTDSGDALWAGCILGWTLLALAWIDQSTFWLPDMLTLPLILAGLTATWWLQPWAITDHAIGAAAAYTLLRLVALGYRRLRGRDGLGEGDAKLLAAAGAWLGWQALPLVLIGAAIAGLAWAALQRLSGQRIDASTALPFGPPLAAATWVVWLYFS